MFWMLVVGFLLNIRYLNLEPQTSIVPRLRSWQTAPLISLNIPFNIPEDKPAISPGF
jgi:hypothetical protein